MGCTDWIVDIISKVFKILWTTVRGLFHLLYFLSLPVASSLVVVIYLLICVLLHKHIEAGFFHGAFISGLAFNLPPAICTYIVSTRNGNIQFSKWKHFMMLSFFLLLIFWPIYFLILFSYLEAPAYAAVAQMTGLDNSTLKNILTFFVVIQMSYQIYVFGPGYVVLKDVWPHLFDICDGLVMVTQMDRDNAPWINVLICVAVVPFFFASYSRLHLVIFPQFQRIVKGLVHDLAEFQFFSFFVVVRVVLLFHSITDIVFTARMLCRFRYKILPKISNPILIQREEEDVARETPVNVGM